MPRRSLQPRPVDPVTDDSIFRISPTLVGGIVGAAIVVLWVTLGFGWMALTLVAAALGAGIGRAFEGRLDPRAVLDALRGRTSG